jgi:hypothetical protein
VTPDDTPEGGVYGSGWVCDVNGEVVADYANTLLKQGDDVYFYYNPNGIGQMLARFVPDSVSVKKGSSASFKLAGKPAGADGDLEPIAGATVYTMSTAPIATTVADGTAKIDAGSLAAGGYEVKAEYNGAGSYNILTNNSALLTIEADAPAPGADTETPELEADYSDAAAPAVIVVLPDGSVTFNAASGVETITVPESALTDDAVIQKAVEIAAAAGGDAKPTIEIRGEATAASGVRKVEVEIPVSGLNSVIDSPVENLKISSAVGEITLNNAAMEDLVFEAGSAEYVKAVIERKDKAALDGALTPAQRAAVSDDKTREIYDVSLYADNNKLDDFKTSTTGGKLTIGLPYTLRSGEIGDGVLVLYVAEDGGTERMTEGRRYDRTRGLAIFRTNHLSIYAVTYETSADPDDPAEDPDDGAEDPGGNEEADTEDPDKNPETDTEDPEKSPENDNVSNSGGGCGAGAGIGTLLALAFILARRRGAE